MVYDKTTFNKIKDSSFTLSKVEGRNAEGYGCRAVLFRLGCTAAHWESSDRPAHRNRNGSRGEV